MNELYQVLSSMMGQEQRIAQIANNLANVSTAGYKKQDLAFQDYMKLAEKAQVSSGKKGAAPDMTTKAKSAGMAWPLLSSQFTNYATGPMQTTGRPLDVAIEGDGFFQVQGEKGETMFTRAGDFTLNAQSQIVTQDGKPVLGDSGTLTLNPAGGPPQISPDGTVSQNGVPVGHLGIVQFQDPQKLEKRGGGLLAAPKGVSPTPVTTPVLRPGTLEGSNVNAIGEMTNMIEVQRAYEVNQKVIQAFDDITGKRISAAMS